MFKKIFIITLLTASAFAVMNANAALSSGSNDGLTLTPYGWVPKSRVIAVPSNESIGISAEGNVVLKDRKTGSIIREYAKVPTKTLTPFDSQRHIKKLPEDIIEYYVGARTKGFSYFTTSWIVPKKPKNPKADAFFYIYSGTSDFTNGSLDSVLKWGKNPENGNSKAYQITNWAHDNGYYVHGASVFVLPGDKLTAITQLKKVGEQGHQDEWHYTQSFLNYPQLDLHVVRDADAREVNVGFLSRTIKLDEIPANLCTKMKNIYVIGEPVVTKLNWKARNIPIQTLMPSGKNTVIVNDSPWNGEIDFYFH